MSEVATVLRWPGAKWRMADWIVSQLPPHDVYFEPFFGSGAVFFTKQPSGTETINDIDDNIVNLFRVIRESADELAAAIEMTPYARSEYRERYETIGDPVEKARRFLVRTWQAYGGKTNCSTAWAHDRTNLVFRPRYWCKLPDRMLNIVQRLKMAQIENKDALELMEMYSRENTLIYVDPPYMKSTRTQLHYKCEFAKEKQHLALLELCRKHKGPLIISGYEIETMQAAMPEPQFQGYLQGNILKYASRMGKKGPALTDAKKILQYATWLVEVLEGKTIDPRKAEGAGQIVYTGNKQSISSIE